MNQNCCKKGLTGEVKRLAIASLLSLVIGLNAGHNSTAAIVRLSPNIQPVQVKSNFNLPACRTEAKPYWVNNITNFTALDSTEKIFTFVEQMPVFPGGEVAQGKFIKMNLRYPVEAMKAGVTGLVVAQFVVNKKGKIHDITIVKSVSPELNGEVIRIIRLMPDFEPALQSGKPVSFRYTLPVRFSLSSSDLSDVPLDTLKSRIFSQAENPPQFPGGESALQDFMRKKLSYPKEAKRSKIEGLVVVQFLVDTNGKLFYPKVTKSVNPVLDAEAMRLVKSLPPFTPARQNNQPVVFRYTLPVRFDR
ncbi:hypothetical protein AAE02nite_16410 [Adhaeribacter aerolatus]|uniref:TonB C-terminal domain-containing protein n=1 Tax=Adhaeribacter aerolatus TaxID=670289 RepID=A0A512AWU4_9BACT|nr:energy transducer TonB [Adhaeribacter aerolatus]GEO03977.1 hypothetical protein AAE02nite_16410 [Adhaeribacter aerolatus]